MSSWPGELWASYDLSMQEALDPTGDAWRQQVRQRVSIELDREALARLIEEDADEAEISYYEAVSDPQARMIDQAQRSYAGQYRRHVRHRTTGATDHNT